MKAIVQDRYGSTDVLALRDVDRPAPADDEVLVRVHAAGVDRGVWHVMAGRPYLIRLMGFGMRAPKNPVPGSDVAGVVETVGARVTRFRSGDEVFGIAKGSFAEYAVAPEAKLAPVPSSLTYVQAAALGISGVTALQAVRDHGKVREGQQVLVLGASGGVGSYAVQLAKTFGAEVTGVCSTTKVDLVRGLGADHVLDYTREDFAATGQRYDVIVDTGGHHAVARLRRALAPRGRLVIVGSETSGAWLGGIDRQVRATVMSPFVGQTMGTFVSKESGEDLRVLADLVEAGRLRPAVDRTYALADAPKAVRYVEEGHARGKVVVTV
jgi:NADPH:quinone reductase-like Zn-dependent oxidoreductase